jgi:hypothetical protein
MITLHALPGIILLSVAMGFVFCVFMSLMSKKRVEAAKDLIISKQDELIKHQDLMIQAGKDVIAKQQEFIALLKEKV